MKVKSAARPLESVVAIPVISPSVDLRTTLVPSIAEPSAVTVTSTNLILLNTPVPVAVTDAVSTDPSMKSIVDEPVICTSLVLDIVTSVSVKSPLPPASIPTLLLEIVMLLIVTGSFVFVPYLNAGPAEFWTTPVKSPPRSLV